MWGRSLFAPVLAIQQQQTCSRQLVRVLKPTTVLHSALLNLLPLQAQAQHEAAAAAAAADAAAVAEAEALVQQQAQQQAELRQQQQLAQRIKQVQPQNGTARVLIADSLYQLALASREYLSGAGVGGTGRPAMAVMAAALWQAPSNGWQAEAAVESSAVASSGAARGEALASQDQEQEWWCSGPLAWKAAEEREQWQAECQAAAAARSTAVTDVAAAGTARQVNGNDGGDGEQQWLQPPVPDWEQALSF